MRLDTKINEQEKPLRPCVVCYLMRSQANNEVLLGLRKQSSVGLGLNLIAGIGGKIELDEEAWLKGEVIPFESETEALVREVHEEIGVTVIEYEHRGRVRFIFPNKPKWNQDVEIYVCTKWEGEPGESDEMKPEWYEIADLEKIYPQMWQDNTFWVHRVLNGESINAIFVYGEDNKTVVDYEIEA